MYGPHGGSSSGSISGSSSGSSSSGSSSGGGNNRERAIARQYSAPVATKSRQASQAREESKGPDKQIGKSLHGGPSVKETLEALEKKQQEEEVNREFEGVPIPTGPIPHAEEFTGITTLPKGHPERIKQEAEKAKKQLATPEGRQEALKEFQNLQYQQRINTAKQQAMEAAGVDINPLQKLLGYRPEFMKGNLPTNLLDKTGLGSFFDPKKMATSFVLNKMGLGMLNPILGIMSLFGFNPNSDQRNQDFFAEKVLSSKNKEKMENLGYKGYMKQRAAGKIDAYGNEIAKGEDKNIMQASIKEFQPTQSQQDQITEVMRKRQVLLEHARTGQLNEKGENTLQQMDQLISQYQVNPESIFKV